MKAKNLQKPLSFAIQMIAPPFFGSRWNLFVTEISPAFCSTMSVMRNLSNGVFKCDVYSVLFLNEIC